MGGTFTSDSQSPVGIRYVNMHPGLSATGAASATSVGVTVKETDIASPFVSMDDSYFINWHLPVENWRKLEDQSVRLPDEKYNLQTAGGALSAKPGTTMVFGDRSLLKDLSVGSALQMAGTVLGAGAGVYALVAGVELASGPAGWLALAAALTGGGGIAVDSLPDPPTEIASQNATSYDAYKTAVEKQESEGNYEDGTPRFTPELAIPDAMLEFKDPAVYLDDDLENNDKFMDRWVSMSGQVIFQVWNDKWIGDAYDSNGYNGNEHGSAIRRSGANYKVNFSAPGWSPPTTTTPTGSDSDSNNESPSEIPPMPPGD